MKKKMNNVHFNYDLRFVIETLLNEGKTITEISYTTRRDRSNIAKEINKHKILILPSTFNNSKLCLKSDSCSVKSYECYLYCKNIEVSLCPRLAFSPHVCNSCTTKNGCRHAKYYYKAFEADNEYRNNWKNNRKGLHYTEEELNILNNDFYYLVIKNKSIYHSLNVINNLGFNFKLRTIYKQIERNELRLKCSNLPRKRKVYKKEETDASYKRDIEGHSYEDYTKKKEDNPNACETQMDTVEGIKENNAPVLLTLEIVEINFLFMFKISSQTSEKVKEQLKNFRDTINKEVFDKIMEILLTDNGKEFINVDDILEVSENINLFYCHPYSSYEKGSIENNHEFIRRVIPKGVSLKPYTQKEINLLCSHINSLFRESLGGKCPFDLVDKYILLDKLKDLGLSKINSLDVCLIPELLGYKNVENIKKYLDEKEIKKSNINFLTEEENKNLFKKGSKNDTKRI